MSQIYSNEEKKIFIKAENIDIGTDVTFGTSIDIRIHGDFKIGDRSHLGDDVLIRGRNVEFGSDLFHSAGLRIGGGGSFHPDSNLKIGDRCTIHNNFINICEPVILGNDVGLSADVSIITHGFWLSVLDGYPARFAGTTLCDGVIVGARSMILMGVTIGKHAVIGAQSVVTKDLEPDGIYGGNPAKLIRKIVPPSEKQRRLIMENIMSKYKEIAAYHNISPSISWDYPIATVNRCRFNVETLTCDGEEDDETDDFRDYLRKWGLRFYTKRPFKSVWQW